MQMWKNPSRALAGWCVASALAVGSGCSDASDPESNDPETGLGPITSGGSSTSQAESSGGTPTSAGPTSGTTVEPGSTSEGGSTGVDDPCLFCNAPNQACVDGACITGCQGQSPSPCDPTEVCDVISGECVAPETACTVSGPSAPCGAQTCGAGSVCDGVDTCIPIAPCANVVCTDDGACWGSSCSCERAIDCTPPDAATLNGPFSTEISDLEFADDCTAWMVTLRSGTDFVRRLTPDGTLTEWPGVANLNMGEIKVLKALTPPPGITRGPIDGLTNAPTPSNDDETKPGIEGAEGLGEVAFTYTCCSACGCFVDPPQGVARLDEDNVASPLPLVIESTVTQGSGPFGVGAADAGPFGLTWGIDRVLYVGNSTNNGELASADLDAGTQAMLGSLPGRITASAPLSAAHLLVGIEGGDVYRYNVLTFQSELVFELGSDITSFSHDAFDGTVYASLRNQEVLALDPWQGTSTLFQMMPSIGRVAVSPNGQLWFTPVSVFPGQSIAPWDLPSAF